MARYRYSKYIPSPIDDLSLEDLLEDLKDFFLESGFYSQFFPGGDQSRSLENLKRALAEILSENDKVPEEWREELREYSESRDAQLSQQVDEFLDQVIERLIEEGYLKPGSQEGYSTEFTDREGDVGEPTERVQFELTDKSVDFLGYKALRELMASLGKSSFGAHSTRELSTGVEADAHSRPYEFGDTLNLDVNATLLSALRREGLQLPLNLEYSDLHVHQSEYQSSCATVLMLDCSHSMILYGEDRFTPAKKVAMALAHLIRTRYPGDTLKMVLFHDSAEEIPIARLASVKVGPYHTNTREGLRLAQRILMNQKKDMRQIIMITDGKPSAVTLPDGRIYKNPFGLDPMILQQTYEEVSKCRRSGILINTFMLAREYHLVEFIKNVTQICRGKAYFTTTLNLAEYILMDYMQKKTRTVH